MTVTDLSLPNQMTDELRAVLAFTSDAEQHRQDTLHAHVLCAGESNPDHRMDATNICSTGFRRQSSMPDLPTGTVTFLFSDIEGSTRLLQQLGDHYADMLREYRRVLRDVFERHGGHEIDASADGFFVVFSRARDAISAAITAQRAMATHPWPKNAQIRLRIGLHTGEPSTVASGYVGLDVHRAARISAAGHGGQILLSHTTRELVEYESSSDMAFRDLGVHRLKDLARPEHLFQLCPPDLPVEFPPLRSLNAFPNNLPVQMTSFIGRGKDIDEVKRLLANFRLVTLTGVGGAGKTRLALQVAAEMLEESLDGVWLVELGGLSDSARLAQTVASVLSVRDEPSRQMIGVREGPGRTALTGLLDYLEPRKVLLILDNCEHVVAECAQLTATLLRACPNLRVLATSREPLGVPGEALWHVPPLSLPDPRNPSSNRSLLQYEAIRLFVERAASVQSSFALTERNASAVTQICHRLDGIPLAIELAAARVPVLSVDQISARLYDRFRFLTGGSRTALPRHQTLQAAIDWSYTLLPEQERTVLRRLSVFARGWTLEAAETVCASEEIAKADVLDRLTELVNKSLVLAEPEEGSTRYRLLETVQQYAREKLMETGEASVLRGHHLSWYLAYAENAEPRLHGPEQAGWLECLEVEHDNFAIALDWSLSGGDAETGLRLAGALWWFCYVRGYFAEGQTWLERALSKTSRGSATVRARALYGAGLLAWAQGDYEKAVELCEESLVLSRRVEDKLGIAYAMTILGVVAHRQSNYEQAEMLYKKGLALSREVGNKWSTALVLLFLGSVALHQRATERATALYEEGLVLSRELGDKHGIAYCLYQLGLAARRQGDYSRAFPLFEESLTLFRELGNKGGMAYSLNMMGWLASRQGENEQAAALYKESLTLSRELGYRSGVAYSLFHSAVVADRQGDQQRAAALYGESLSMRCQLGDKRGIAECLEGMGNLAWLQGQPQRAARLIGAAEGLGGVAGVPQPTVQYGNEHDNAALRRIMEEAGFATALAEGRAMTLEQVCAYALNESQDP